MSWVYSPGVRNSWRSPVNFESFSMTTERAGMLMPSASVSVAKTTFTRPGGERLLHRLLHRRHHARVVRGEPGLEPGEPRVVAEHRRGRRRRATRSWRSAIARICAALARVGEAQPGGEALLDRLVAAGAAEHEHDRRAACSRRRGSSTVSTRLGVRSGVARGPRPRRATRGRARRRGVADARGSGASSAVLARRTSGAGGAVSRPAPPPGSGARASPAGAPR